MPSRCVPRLEINPTSIKKKKKKKENKGEEKKEKKGRDGTVTVT